MSGWSGPLGSTNQNYKSTSAMDNATRSPLVMLLNGISTSDTYRVEVVYTVEYIPTSYFTAWS